MFQFADLAHFQSLDFSSSWPAATISDTATSVGTLTASAWNYGSNFGGPTHSSWTSGADTVHADTTSTGGMFGSWGVVDTTYSAIDASKAVTGMNTKITLCPGTAGATCSG